MPSKTIRSSARRATPRTTHRRLDLDDGGTFGAAGGGDVSAGAVPARAGDRFAAGLSGLAISPPNGCFARRRVSVVRSHDPGEPPFLHDGRNALRSRRHTAGIAALHASQHVADVDPENRRVAVLETFDPPILEE